jgi:hypothetical protein
MPKNWNGNLVVFAQGGPFYMPPTAASLQRLSARGVKAPFGYGPAYGLVPGGVANYFSQKVSWA